MAGTATTAFATALCAFIMNATPIANIGDNAASSPATEFYLSLHEGSPAVGGNQTTNEADYSDYDREPVDRDSDGWTCSGAVATLTAEIAFTIGSGGGGTIDYMGIGLAASSTGNLLLFGALTPSIESGAGVTPRLATGTSVTFS